MSRKRLGFILIGVGVVLGLIVGAIVVGQVNEVNQIRAAQPKAQVVIATGPIEERTEITAAQVRLAIVSDEVVAEGTATDPTQVVGNFTPTPIKRGEMINLQRIGKLAAKNSPSFTIEKGKVMYAMPLQLPNQPPFTILQVNAIRPGDRVDFIYTTFSIPDGLGRDELDAARTTNAAAFLQTRFMLQNLRIQQIGRFDETGKIVPDPTYMLLTVAPEEALVLKWLKDASQYFGNSIEMVLRTPTDDEKVDPSLVVNLRYMRDKYGLPEPPVVRLQPPR